jgi:tRNA-specific 2-thiouridylase
MTGPARRVLIAMSGGVDSSVAASLLREQGWDVIGATLQLRRCDEVGRSRSCCGAAGVTAARAVAGRLGISHYVLDRSVEFERLVLRPCWDEYARGRTPNPCVICNEQFKFGLLRDFAHSLGVNHVATGHYARLAPVASDGAPRLWRAVDRRKDQAYFLFALDAAQLADALFPLGEIEKPQVRELARARGFANAEQAESQDACFVGEDETFAEMLRQRFQGEARPGPIVDMRGVALGRHEGIHHFTIGQRQGLGVALGKPAWVCRIEPDTARVVLTTDPADTLAPGMTVAAVRWHDTPRAQCQVQIRYRHAAVAARIEPRSADRVIVRFATPQRAVTPGQAAVFFDGDLVLGGGWIEAATPD